MSVSSQLMLTSVDYPDSLLTTAFAHFLQHSWLHSTAMPYFGKPFTKFDVHGDFSKDEKTKTAREVSIKVVMTEGNFWILFTLPWGCFLPVWGCFDGLGKWGYLHHQIYDLWLLRITEDSTAVMPRLNNVDYLYVGFFVFSIRWTVTIGAKGLCFWLLFSSVMLQYHCK